METCCGYAYATIEKPAPRSPRFSRAPRTRAPGATTKSRCGTLPALGLPLRTIRFRRPRRCCSYFRAPAVRQKRELFPGRVQASRDGLNVAVCALDVRRNVNRLPFRRTGHPLGACFGPARALLRSGSPLYHCGAQGTVFHFSHQGSRLIHCYSHQDLH